MNTQNRSSGTTNHAIASGHLGLAFAIAVAAGIGCKQPTAPTSRAPEARSTESRTSRVAADATTFGGATASGGEDRSDGSMVPLADVVETPLDDKARQAADDLRRFGLELLHRLPEDNAVVAPIDLGEAIAVLSGSARNVPREQMRRVLHLEGLKDPGEAAYAVLQAFNAPRPGVTMQRPWRVWHTAGIGMDDAYQRFFFGVVHADVGQVEFEREGGGRERDIINSWVREQTDGRVPALFPPGGVRLDERCAIVDILRLHASWPAATRPPAREESPFRRADGQGLGVAFSQRTGDFAALPGRPVVEVPLSGDLGIVLALPTPGQDESALEVEAVEGLDGWVEGMKRERLDVAAPHWTADPEASISAALKALGMTDAFDPARADFTGFTFYRLSLSAVAQAVVLQLDDPPAEGPPAGAKREGDGVRKLRFDAPFFYGIRDRRTRAWVAFGRVRRPD